MTKEESEEIARSLWHRIADGNVAQAVTMIAAAMRHHVNREVEAKLVEAGVFDDDDEFLQ